MSIKLEHINYVYSEGTAYEKHALKDVSLEIPHGEFVGIIGHTGSGKSTLIQHLNGLIKATSGALYYNGENIYGENYNLRELRNQVGLVFQYPEHQLFETDVLTDVCFGPKNLGLPQEEVEKRVNHALKQIHIEHLRDKQIYKMSGGEKKMASIATILAMTPDIILMDEPSAALDPQNRRNLIRVLNEFSYLKLIASHDLDFVWDTCDRTILLSEGRIVCDGDTREILSDRKLLEAHGLELPLSLYRK